MRFDAHDTTGARRHFEWAGFCLFHHPDLERWLCALAGELRGLVDDALARVAPAAAAVDAPLGVALWRLASIDRGAAARVYDAAHALPGAFRLCSEPGLLALLEEVGCERPTLNALPRIRFDFPGEPTHSLGDHQDRHFNGGSRNAVTVWTPLEDVPTALGPLRIRPGSHRDGTMPARSLETRPYVELEGGAWQKRYPEMDMPMKVGELAIFHMDLVHASGVNCGDRARLSVQLRYDNLGDSAFAAEGWPPSFRVLPRADLHRDSA